MTLFAVEFSIEALGIIGSLGLLLTGTIGLLFKMLIEAKDAQIALNEANLALKIETDAKLNNLAMALQAAGNLEIAASRYAAAEGKSIPEALVPVVPRHRSPTTKEQREDAEIQTLQARITRASLILDLPARQPTAMESPEDAAVRQGKPQPTKDDLILDGLNEIKLGQADDKAKQLIQKIAPEPTPVEVKNEEPLLVQMKDDDKDKIAEAVVKALDSPVNRPRGKVMCGSCKTVNTKTRIITITEDDGTDSTIHVAAGASVTCNGKDCGLGDLKAGDKIECNDDPATTVAATR